MRERCSRSQAPSRGGNDMGSQRVPVDVGDLKNEDKVKKCPECGGTKIEYHDGEFVCMKCGLVIE